MSTINLTIRFNQTGAIAHRVRYARIDNIVTPSFVTVSPDVPNNPTSVVTIAENIPNGQYEIRSLPLYADQRVCNESIVQTDPCPSLISINAFIQGGNLIISYLAPSQVPQVRMTINYPNGGTDTVTAVNDGNDIVRAIPSGLYGTYTVQGQSVCDPNTGFYSAFSSQVSIERFATNVQIINLSSDITVTDVLGITGFTLSQFVLPGNSVSGSHDAFFGGITVAYSGTVTSNYATLKLNNTVIQCVNLTSSPTNISFSSASFGSNDNLTIEIGNGLCSSAPGGNIFIANQTSGSNDVSITNVMMGSTVNVAGGYPIAPNEEKGTTHSTFTGIVSVTITSTPVTGTRSLRMFVNTILVECIDISGDPNGTWNFTNRNYNLNDLIDVLLADTAC